LDSPLLERIFNLLEVPLPQHDTMEEYLDTILPVVRPWSEDLPEEEYFLGKPWLEVRDDDSFHEAVLHFFNERNEYLQSVDGNVHRGAWRLLAPGTNKILVDQMAGGNVVRSEIFDLAYLDDYFFILKKHGDQSRKGLAKYFVMGYEPAIRGLEWRDVMELLFNKYRSNNRFYRNIFILIILIVVAVILFSVF
jgi:hypothetical protein